MWILGLGKSVSSTTNNTSVEGASWTPTGSSPQLTASGKAHAARRGLSPYVPHLLTCVLMPSLPFTHPPCPRVFHPNEMLDMMSFIRHWGSEQRVVVTQFDVFWVGSHQIPSVLSPPPCHSYHKSSSHLSGVPRTLSLFASLLGSGSRV